MTATEADRRRWLESLLRLDRPLESVLTDLSGLGWDSDEELITLKPAHVVEILNRFKSGRLDAQGVERWANAIEGRDDVGFDGESRELLREAVLDLANPSLQGALTLEVADRWIERLTGQ